MSEFKLILESENVGAWMAINNAFTYEWGDAVASTNPGSRYWNGVLIQLGKFRNIENDEFIEAFTTIEFFQGDPPVLVGSLTGADFENGNILWINIVKNGSLRGEPVPLDAFRQRLKLGQIKDKDKSFVRAHPLHHYLQPYPGGITLWHDKGYKIDAAIRETRNGEIPHVEHTFTLEDVEIEILRLRGNPAMPPSWEELTMLRENGGGAPKWDPCPSDVEKQTLNQRAKARGGRREPPRWMSVDKIVVRDPGSLGQNIGKNPPQTP